MRAPRLDLALVSALALTTACDGTLVGPDRDGGPGELPACETMLTIDPSTASIAPRGVLVLRATGGTGAYLFAIDDDGGTGTRVADTTGVLVGGDLPGAAIVRVEDRGCSGSATATIEVTDALVLQPGTAEVAPGGEIRFEARGGEGPFTYSLTRDTSGATIDGAGVYRAGAGVGDDVIRVSDAATGARADARVTVVAGASLRPLSPLVFLPVGATHELAMLGGSGYVDATESSDALEIEEGRVRASAPGSAEVALTDRYTGARATVRIDAVLSQDAPGVRVGDRSELNTVLAGDFDEDGDVDALLAMPGSGVAGYRQGAIYVYRNDGSGLEVAPARVLTGARREDMFGTSVALGDLDADGHDDLVIGAWQADPSGGNVGAVVVHRGAPGMLFEDEPALAFAGTTGSDRFGVAVATCDFDGDGDLDLAVGAADAEDRGVTPRNDQQGAVYIYPSYGGRFLGVAAQTIWGALPDGAGGFTSFKDIRFGSVLAAGDVDGDGLCDLAVQAQRADVALANDGAVLLFRGRAGLEGRQGGLEPRPSLVIAATETGDRGSRFGQSIALGDLDGDGLDELAISQHGHDETGATDAGALRVFTGRALSGAATAALAPSDADWTHASTEASRNFGHAVRIAEATGDGRLDLVVSDSRAALEGSMLTRPGVIRVFAGRAGALPDAMPTIELEGTSNEERFGQALAVLGDVTGDGRVDLFALAVFADRDGLDTGVPQLVASDSDRRALELPGLATGRRFGLSIAVVGDVTGDGRPDLAVSAPRASDMRTAEGTSRGLEHGAVFLYRGADEGFSLAPDLTFFDHPGHSESDVFGEAVAPAGDFDGDGIADLAIVARQEDQPATYDDTRYVLDGTCPTAARSDTGAVFVYRGVASGLPSTTPAFVIYGPAAGRNVQAVVGGLDVDGDGTSDLVLGGPNWLDGEVRVGGVGLVRGRAADPTGKITVICGLDWIGYGDAANDELGTSLAALGDLDGDGCDEVAVGAPLADRAPVNDEGLVRVLFGFGGVGCPATVPSMLTMRPMDRASHAGRALASGVDLDRDGALDLVIGAPRYTTVLGEIGRAYVVTGAYLASQRGATTAISMLDPDGAVIDGVDPGERAGSSVAMVPNVGERGAIAVGGAFAAISGTPDTGGVRFVGWTATGPARSPLALFSGETVREGSELGTSIVPARIGTRTFIVVGGSWGHAHSLDHGSAYSLPF